MSAITYGLGGPQLELDVQGDSTGDSSTQAQLIPVRSGGSVWGGATVCSMRSRRTSKGSLGAANLRVP